MRLSDLINAASERTGIDPKKVKQFARDLMESGEIPKAIGRSVPEMEQSHRAKLVLTLASTNTIRGSSEAMRDRWDAKLKENGPLQNMDDVPTFGSLLTEWMDSLAKFDERAYELALTSCLYVNMSRPLCEIAYNESGMMQDVNPFSHNFVGKSASALMIGSSLLWQDAKGIIFRSRISGSVLIEIASGLSLGEYSAQIMELERQRRMENETSGD